MPALSAGLLLYRVRAGAQVEVLLVHPGGPFWANREEHAWSIPKGEYPAHEDPRQAAEREFYEELGRRAPAGPREDLGEIRQSGGKRVRAWAVRASAFSADEIASNEFEMEWPPGSGELRSFPEIDRAQWTSVDEARRLLIRAQVDFLDRLLDRLVPDGRSATGTTAQP
jgi:predicted NUDIX family NTP pyrophosphohydrolase